MNNLAFMRFELQFLPWDLALHPDSLPGTSHMEPAPIRQPLTHHDWDLINLSDVQLPLKYD